MQCVICFETAWKSVGNLLEIFGKFVGNVWDIGQEDSISVM